MKKVLLICGVLFVTGCTSFQPSHYTAYNTPYGTRVIASGVAANNSALANSSYNCPSCAISGLNSMGRSARTQTQNFSNDIIDSGMRTFNSALSGSINSAIRDAFK